MIPMKKITIVLHLFLSISLFSQQIINHTIDSYELDEKREVRIYLPASYNEDTERQYPLTVVFDAEYLFDVYVGNAILFAQKDKAPEQIIIGINQNYNDILRYRDCAFDKNTSYPTGKSESFYRFIRSEVLAYLEENYRVSPFRTIVGNTLTANFTNYFFIEDSPGFNAFININPNYAPDMSSLLVSNAQNVSKNSYYYYLNGGDYISEKRAKGIAATNSQLASIKNEKFNYKYDDLSGSTSISSIGQAIPRALAFIFEIYSSISKQEFNTKIKDLSPRDAIAYLENKYLDSEYLFGTNPSLRERDVYAIESIIIDKENGDYLRDFGEMIARLSPKSHLGDYYIGLSFEMKGRYKRAIEAYKEGYMKIKNSPDNADRFYQNVERVAKKMN
ncbi:MAG: putative alpha/beta superfamily hydrolase [Saprospiraceae bacterium]|jgi:predicted alpha/beta superfamily hydrolase